MKDGCISDRMVREFSDERQLGRDAKEVKELTRKRSGSGEHKYWMSWQRSLGESLVGGCWTRKDSVVFVK